MLLKTLGFLTVTRHHVTVTHLCTLYCFWKTSGFATLIFTPLNKRLSLWSQLNTHAFRFSLGAWTPPSFVQLTGRRDFWWLCWSPESSLRLTDTPETASGTSGKRGPLQARLHQCSGGCIHGVWVPRPSPCEQRIGPSGGLRAEKNLRLKKKKKKGWCFLEQHCLRCLQPLFTF